MECDYTLECFAQVNYVIIVKWISLVRVLTLNKKKERKKESGFFSVTQKVVTKSVIMKGVYCNKNI
jgi:hypothetical protein